MRASKPRRLEKDESLETRSISVIDCQFRNWLCNNSTPPILEFAGKKIPINDPEKKTVLTLECKDMNDFFGSTSSFGEKFVYSRLVEYPNVPFFRDLPSCCPNELEDGIENMDEKMQALFDKISNVFGFKKDCLVTLGGITYQYSQRKVKFSPIDITVPESATSSQKIKLVMRGDEILFASTDEKKINDYVEKNIIRVREITLN